MKHWREYYLAKHKRKHFGGINIGDFDTIISYMCLICSLEFFLICACCLSGVVDMEAEECTSVEYLHVSLGKYCTDGTVSSQFCL